ncbi:hypothetical protein AMTRI_Chr06g196520 [Amborella trichopoda]
MMGDELVCNQYCGLFVTFALLFLPVHPTTDQSDVGALEILYNALNDPVQLTGWKSNGGDPCGESWKGISCSGTAVTSIQIPGLGLSGTLGYGLSGLLSLITLDVSGNNLHDIIPYQLPPNTTFLNLANNNFSGNLPYSISGMTSLNYLNASHNSLSQSIGDLFTNLQDLSALDLSFNNLTGDLPNSFGSLSNLSTLYLQDNQLTGPVNLLSSVPLSDLNIEKNHFSGWIPEKFKTIPNLSISGNSFDTGPAPPPPPYTSPPPNRAHNGHNTSGTPTTKPRPEDQGPGLGAKNKEEKLAAGAIVGMVMGSLLMVVAAIFAIVFCLRKFPRSKKENNGSGSTKSISVVASKASVESQEQKSKAAPITDLKPPPVEWQKIASDRTSGKPGAGKRTKAPITATSYAVAELQTATNSFSQECLVGEGSLGRVYRADFSNGKILAVKKIDSSALSLQEEDNFLEAVSNMSRLRHPNITTLLGYCAEHGQHLLVYEYFGNGTLHDMLHFTDDNSKALTWNARVRIALGTARALEYLHEVCLPSVVHRNFKSANILLDEELNPHLSDCGLAALTPNTERQVSTQMLGSFGYSAPEFAMSGIYTVKSDVYSFGVVMLELLTGRKPLDSSRQRSEQSLVRWATPQLHDIDALAKMVDPALKGIYPAKSLSRFADIIALCVQPEPEFRPPMSEVVQALVRLMQRASMNKRRSSDESGIAFKMPDYEQLEMSF